jgi:hypothetical protein
MSVKGSSQPGGSDPGFVPSNVELPPAPYGTRPVMATWNGTEWIYSPSGISGETHDVERIIVESKETIELERIGEIKTILEREGLTAEQTKDIVEILEKGAKEGKSTEEILAEVRAKLIELGIGAAIIAKILASIELSAKQNKEILELLERGTREGKTTEQIIKEVTIKLETFGVEKTVIEKIVTTIEHIIEGSVINPMEWLAEFVFGASYKVGDVVKLTQGYAKIEGHDTPFDTISGGAVTGAMSTPNAGQLPLTREDNYPFFDLYAIKATPGKREHEAERPTLEPTAIDATAKEGRPEIHAFTFNSKGELLSATGGFVGQKLYLVGGGGVPEDGILYIAVARQPADEESPKELAAPQYGYTATFTNTLANTLAGAGVYINQEAIAAATNPAEDSTHWVPTALNAETGEAAEAKKLAEEAKELANDGYKLAQQALKDGEQGERQEGVVGTVYTPSLINDRPCWVTVDIDFGGATGEIGIAQVEVNDQLIAVPVLPSVTAHAIVATVTFICSKGESWKVHNVENTVSIQYAYKFL